MKMFNIIPIKTIKVTKTGFSVRVQWWNNQRTVPQWKNLQKSNSTINNMLAWCHHKISLKIIDVKCFKMSLVEENHMNNKLRLTQRVRQDSHRAWTDTRYCMEVNNVDLLPCKQRTWMQCKSSIIMNIMVKVEVTDKHHLMFIYKALTQMHMVLSSMLDNEQALSRKREYGVVRNRQDLSQGQR
jgi:hypothetical protein